MTSIVPNESLVDGDALLERLASHAAWLARGRAGEGRLELATCAVSGSLANADLSYASIESTRFDDANLSGARLDGARIRNTSFARTDLRLASCLETRFEDSDFRRALVAGAVVGRTGFLRCALGDFAAQPIGKPDVRGPYTVVAPDFSAAGDRTRVGSPAELDARWFAAPADGVTRRFSFDIEDGVRFVAQVMHMHVAWSRESGPRLHDRMVYQTFGQFLSEGAPASFCGALPDATETQLRETIRALVTAWTPDSVSGG